MSKGSNTRTNRDSIKVNGEVRSVLRETVARGGAQAKRAAGILASGSQYMSRRVLVDMARNLGVAA